MELYLRDYFVKILNQQKVEKEQDDIVELINKDDVRTNLLSLIRLLEPYTMNKRQDVRLGAVLLLSKLIHFCDQSKITEDAVSVLVAFYCNRLSDTAIVPNLVSDLDALIQFKDQFSPANASLISSSIFRCIDVQSFPHITRNVIFLILKNLLENYHHQLDSNIFIPGIISAMKNEKDPRNLKTVYETVSSIVKLLNISDNQIEPLFNATFCYFPIAFRPPPDSPYSITSKHLKLILRECMASTPLFAPFAFSLLQRKLASTSGSAKKDTLETITACVPVYGPNNLVLYASNLFDSVKMEIINGDPDPGLRDPCLETIHALSVCISQYDDSKKAIQLLKPIVDECILLLEDFDEDSIKPASLILRSVASASSFTYSLVENVILPILLRQYRDTTEEMEHYLIICTMVALIQARKMVYGVVSEEEVEQEKVKQSQDSVMLTYKERLLDIFNSAITSSNQYPQLRLMGILGLGLFCVLKDYMTDTERRLAVCTLGDVLEREEEERIRMPTLLALSDISISYQELIIEYTIPLLYHLLPDQISDEKIPYKLTLEAFERLSISPNVFFIAQDKLLEKFEIALKYHDKSYSQSIISTLLKIIQTKDVQKHPDMKQYIKSIGFRLIKFIILESLSSSSNNMIFSDSILNIICRIIIVLFKNLDTDAQKEILISIYQLFKHGDLSILDNPTSATTVQFCPLLANAPKNQHASTLLFSVFISTLQKSVKVEEDSEESFLDDITEQVLKCDLSLQLSSFCRCIASVINKWDNDTALTNYIQNVESKLNKLIVESKSQQALILYLWITKALIMRSHKLSKEMIDKVILLIDHHDLGKEAAMGFDILIGDDELSLNKDCFATVSILYKQKFMVYSLPKLLDRFNNNTGNKTNYLIAVAYLLKNEPKSILINELPPLVPLLIESISLPEVVLKISTLNLFEFALDENIMSSSYLVTLLPTLLKLTKEPNMKVRMASLKCLTLIPSHFPNEMILPLQKDTIKQLASARDDKKRLVRKQVVECLESWYLIGGK